MMQDAKHHYDTAEDLLDQWSNPRARDGVDSRRAAEAEHWIAVAQVHATLAVAAFLESAR